MRSEDGGGGRVTQQRCTGGCRPLPFHGVLVFLPVFLPACHTTYNFATVLFSFCLCPLHNYHAGPPWPALPPTLLGPSGVTRNRLHQLS